jgi:hypothetical protein
VSMSSDGFEIPLSRYIVGIDLGTTNCAVAWVDTEATNAPTQRPATVRAGANGEAVPQTDLVGQRIACFPIKQWVEVGVQEPRELLPSFHYQVLSEERSGTGGDQTVVGILARDRANQLPGRVIASAKSWLCHAGVDRTSPILPWQSDAEVQKISPVDACSAYLSWIRRSWDEAHPNDPLAQQEVVITLPASFDQVARRLTIEAAERAGLKQVTPIEEPQAAFYAWLSRNEPSWEQLVQAGQTILVCDIGGGTTDFTLIRVRETGDDRGAEPQSTESTHPAAPSQPFETLHPTHARRLTLHRVAVGQHLILGGDNIDAALARFAENKLTGGTQLPPRSWDALLAACRGAKESLLGPSPPEVYTIHLPGTGSKLIGGGQQVQLARCEVMATVLDGFFPLVDLLDRPCGQETGFQEFGLPYAEDPAVTRHLASFLWDHRFAGRTQDESDSWNDWQLAKPDWILFNGGVMTSRQLTDRLLQVIANWFVGRRELGDEMWRPRTLDSDRLDLAVAFGAAYFGMVSRGSGVKIEANLGCSYYLQVSDDPPQAVCIVPGSASPGDQFRLDQVLELAVGQPVQFPILYSSTRLADSLGQSVPLNAEEFARLPPIRTVMNLPGRKRRELLPVRLSVELSQIGTLQMWCATLDDVHRWQLEFDIRGSAQASEQAQDATANQLGTLDESSGLTARHILEQTFGAEEPRVDPSKTVSEIARCLNLSRNQWPPNLLRSMWQALMDLSEGRRRSPDHESRWLNLLGYVLRPGYGMAGDDWRVAETWRNIHGKLVFGTASSKREAHILWRRIAGGFTAGQQLTVYQQIAGPLRQTLDPARRAKGGGKSGSVAPTDLIELLRLVGSLELLPQSEKSQLGGWAIDLMSVRKYQPCQSALLWCLARLGARQPAYGPLNCVVGIDDVSAWLERLMGLKIEDSAYDLALMQCARRVGRSVPRHR